MKLKRRGSTAMHQFLYGLVVFCVDDSFMSVYILCFGLSSLYIIVKAYSSGLNIIKKSIYTM